MLQMLETRELFKSWPGIDELTASKHSQRLKGSMLGLEPFQKRCQCDSIKKSV